jgi:hypothetical protein
MVTPLILLIDQSSLTPSIASIALLSEQSLAKDWLNPDEDEAWSHLK